MAFYFLWAACSDSRPGEVYAFVVVESPYRSFPDLESQSAPDSSRIGRERSGIGIVNGERWGNVVHRAGIGTFSFSLTPGCGHPQESSQWNPEHIQHALSIGERLGNGSAGLWFGTPFRAKTSILQRQHRPSGFTPYSRGLPSHPTPPSIMGHKRLHGSFFHWRSGG